MRPMTVALLLILLSEALPLALAQKTAERVAVTKQELLELINPSPDQAGLIQLIERHGIDFQPTDADVKIFRALGASDGLVDAIRKSERAATPRETKNDT